MYQPFVASFCTLRIRKVTAVVLATHVLGDVTSVWIRSEKRADIGGRIRSEKRAAIGGGKTKLRESRTEALR